MKSFSCWLEPSRSPGGHRRYGEQHLRRRLFIRRCRDLGFSIEETTNLAALCEGGDYTCRAVRDLMLGHLDAVSAKIHDLQKLEQSLRQMVLRCDGALQPDCPVVDVLEEPAKSE